MRGNRSLLSCFAILVFLMCLGVLTLASEEGGRSLGVYVYENIEGYHQSAAMSGPGLFEGLKAKFDVVDLAGKVPLQSNETVRILEKMTEDRKVTVTNVSTWLTGGVIAAPSITFADDDIKFMDLTWHIDEDAVVEDAVGKKHSHVLVGTLTGYVKKSSTNSKTLSVTASGTMKLMSTADRSVLWSNTYSDVKAGFDARVAFGDAVKAIAEAASKDIAELE